MSDDRAARVRAEMQEMESRRAETAGMLAGQAVLRPHVHILGNAQKALERFWWGTPKHGENEHSWKREQNGFLHSLADGLAEVFADIRKKCVEEGWFGREVSPKEMDVTHHGGIHGQAAATAIGMSFLELCRDNERQHPAPSPDQGKGTPGVDW